MSTTEEMNRVIYEYMGKPRPICKDLNGNDFDMDFTPNYHTSWDALMPVIDKIESTVFKDAYWDVQGFSVGIDKVHVCVRMFNRGRQDGIIYQTPWGTLPVSKITEVFTAVVSTIEWLKIHRIDYLTA